MRPIVTIITGIFCYLLVLCNQSVSANSGEQLKENLFQGGVTAYSKGDYKEAIEKFESLATEGFSAPLLYNLGNSYAQAGQTGKAILNYERALRLVPGDSDIQGNLEFLRKEKGLFQEEQTFIQRFVTLLALNQWIAVATVSCIVFAGVLLLPGSRRLRGSSRYGVAFVLLVIALTACAGAFGQYQHWYDGVVVAADARLRVSPFETAASIGSIQEGRLLRPVKKHSTFVLVVDESGRRGWLPADSFESIAL